MGEIVVLKAMTNDPIRSTLPFEAWPLADRRLWERATAAGRPWEDSGLAGDWSDAHRQHVMWAYGRWLRFLATTGALTDFNPTRRVSRERLVAYIQSIEGQVRPRTTYNYVRNLFEALRIMVPAEAWSELRAIVGHLRKKIHPNPEKRGLLRDAQHLYELGIGLMQDAEQRGTAGSLRQAVDYRDGLLIALLAARPLRRRTLLSTRISENLSWNGKSWILYMPPAATKTRRPIEVDLPQDLTSYLDRYLNHYRRRFKAADEHDALWASKNGRPMGGQALYRVVTRRTEAAFGRPIPPHLFRDCVATSIAIRDPRHVQTIAHLLGQSRLDTSYRHYIQAGAVEASRAHGDGIQALRDQRLKPKIKPSGARS